MADAKAEDIQELLGGALFKALYKWMVESGPVYLLPTGQEMLSPFLTELCFRVCHRPMQIVQIGTELAQGQPGKVWLAELNAPAGPVSSFLVVSDPAAAKHVLRSTDNPNRPIYVKGLVQEVPRPLHAVVTRWCAGVLQHGQQCAH